MRSRRRIAVSKKELGSRLRALRQSHGISQSQVARLLGVDQSHISNVERGVRGLTIQQVVKLSRALAVPTDEILNNGRRPPAVRSLRSGRMLRRLQRIEELPVAQQQAILKILDGLLYTHTKTRT